MQFLNMQGLKCNFISKNMHLNEFYKHAEDLCAILKHAGSKMQFYKQKYDLTDAVHDMEDLYVKIKMHGGKDAMQ